MRPDTRYRIRTGRLGRLAFACGLLMIAVPLAVSLVERARAARQPGPEVFVGQLAVGTMLVATRGLPDPNFSQTVVLLIQYGPGSEGAAGLVLNRPAGVSLAGAMPGVEAVSKLTTPAFLGGPVSPDMRLALSRTPCEGCRVVGRDIHLVTAMPTLERLVADGGDHRRLRVYVGYAGWRGGQLEEEVRRGAWRVVPADAAAVFDADPATLWQRLLARAEAVLAAASGYHPCSSDVCAGPFPNRES